MHQFGHGDQPVYGFFDLFCSLQPNGTEYHLIEQVQICLNKDFTPKSCGVEYEEYLLKYAPQSSCPRKYDFNYPPIQHV